MAEGLSFFWPIVVSRLAKKEKNLCALRVFAVSHLCVFQSIL